MNWYRGRSPFARVVLIVLAVLVVLVVIGYVLGAPADARAAIPKCTRASPCTAAQAAQLKALGQAGKATDEVVNFSKVAATGYRCRTRSIRHTVHNKGLRLAMFWATLSKTWCWNKKGKIVFAPK